MKHEEEFKAFLKTVKHGSRTKQLLSAKVASDTISRCKQAERLLEIELSVRTFTDDAAVDRLCARIKCERLTATKGRPYAYNDLIVAVRTYREFVIWRSAA